MATTVLWNPAEFALPASLDASGPPPPPPSGGSYTQQTPPSTVRRWIRQLANGYVFVTDKFVGGHSLDWPDISYGLEGLSPSGNPSTNIDFGAIRSHDYAGRFSWAAMEPAGNGTRDWTKMQNWYDTFYGQGKFMAMMVFGTPEPLASSTLQSYRYPSWRGCNYVPKDNASWDKLEAFVQALVTQFPNIGAIETPNEPSPGATYDEKNQFLNCVSEQLSRWQGCVYRGTKAADPTMPVWGPAMVYFGGNSDPNTGLTDFGGGNAPFANVLSAIDPTSGKKLHENSDVISLHYYGNPDTDPLDYDNYLLKARVAMTAAGCAVDKPLVNSESAFNQSGLNWSSTSVTNQAAKFTKIRLGIGAARGLLHDFTYAFDGGYSPWTENNLGKPYLGGTMATAISAAHTALSNFSIYECALLNNGNLWISGLKSGSLFQIEF